MRSERFHAEDFRGVMSAEQKIYAEFFGGNSGPVRSFAGDKRVDVFVRDPIDFRTGASGHNANHANLLRTEIENIYRTTECFLQFAKELTTRHRRTRFQPDRLPFVFQKWLRGF